MTRHDKPVSRLACLRVLRHGRFAFTVTVADQAAMAVRGISLALRRLRMEGLLDRRHDGAWRLTAAGQLAAERETEAARVAAVWRQRHSTERHARCGRTCVESRPAGSRLPTAVGPYGVADLAALRSAGALRLYLGSPPPPGCDPPAPALATIQLTSEDVFTARLKPPAEMSGGELLVECAGTRVDSAERPGETLRDRRLTAVFTELVNRVNQEATDGPPAPDRG